MPPRRRQPIAPLLRYALAAARGDGPVLERAIADTRRAGWARVALEEVALMLTLYAGYPSAIETLKTLAESWPATAPSAGEVEPETRREVGLATLARIYGPVRPQLLRGLATLHPALAAWVIEHGYGRVLARNRLDLRARELVTVSLLAAGCWTRQLAAHAVGAERAGATRAELSAALAAGAAAVADPRIPRTPRRVRPGTARGRR
ncbi:MAG: carboxymuconolactone decarboxylase family protein [Candidatus Eisenbacteria bacterium]